MSKEGATPDREPLLLESATNFSSLRDYQSYRSASLGRRSYSTVSIATVFSEHRHASENVPSTLKVYDNYKEKRSVERKSLKNMAVEEVYKACKNPSRKCKSFANSLYDSVPAFQWMASYDRKKLAADALAGFTVAVLLIPQSMAYALLAGLPPIYGMYSSSFVLIIFALFTSSKTLSIGPVATTAILIDDAVSRFGLPDETPEHAALTITLCFVTGIVQLLMGIFHLGFIAKLLSRPVMSGFTTGAACIIAVHQCRDLFGLTFVQRPLFGDALVDLFKYISGVDWLTLGIGVSSLIILLSVKYNPLKKYVPKWFPIPLILIAAGIGISYWLDFESKGVRVVGPVPGGIGKFEPPNLSTAPEMIVDGIILSAVSYMGSIALAETFAARHRENVDANQELVAFGIACLFGSFNQCHTVSGSFSRTALNEDMGAKTQAHGIFTAFLLIFALLFFTSVFEYLPKCILAAMILTSVRSLLDYRELLYLTKSTRIDLLQFWATIISTLFIGIKEGILIGMGVSFVMLIFRSVTPRLTIKGNLKGTTTYVDVNRFPEAKTYPGIKIIGFSNELNYGNSKVLKNELVRMARDDDYIGFEAVIIDMEMISNIDSSALRDLTEVLEECVDLILVVFAAVPGEVRDVMDRVGMRNLIGFQTYFVSVHDAVSCTMSYLRQTTDDPAKLRDYERFDRKGSYARERESFAISENVSFH